MTSKHTVSLSLAKQMKKAGWEKETLFWWVEANLRDFDLLHESEIKKHWRGDLIKYPAPIASEILEELPDKLRIGSVLKLHKHPNHYSVFYSGLMSDDEDDFGFEMLIFKASTPQEALGKCWIYLKENKLI